MRIAMFLVVTVVALVLLFSYRTSRSPGALPAAAQGGGNQVGVVSGPDPVGTPATAGNGGSAGSGGSSGGGSSGGSGASSQSANTVVNGNVVPTRWGPVQVQVVITGGRITDVKALVYPQTNGLDLQINGYALPILHDSVIAAQGANIDAVTGATVTSNGYIASLQSALDMAHFP
jgi:uncharacterized protein with FMN-binding domain